MGSVKQVAEVVLNVSDLDGMKMFYQHTLGFTLHSEFPESEPTIVFLTICDVDSPLGRGGHPQLFALIDAERHAFTRDNFVGIDHRTSSLNHLAFEIDEADYETEQQRLAGLGLEVTTTEFPHMRAKAIFFRDPEGNLLELICHASD